MTMDFNQWLQQHIPFTEIQRGGPGTWPAGTSRAPNDPLGPVMHLHDDASEIFYFIAGRARLEIGNTEEYFGPGDFVLVPPGTPHNLWNGGDKDLYALWIVAPNFVNNKWRTDNFPDGAMDRRATWSRVGPTAQLPSDTNIESRVVTLSPGERLQQATGERQEAILYIFEGGAHVTVGHLGGTLAAHQCVHVPVETDYTVASDGRPASLIVFHMGGTQR
jgi:mannose-6-phosphate isomerase-like protein (cupin superfamily)